MSLACFVEFKALGMSCMCMTGFYSHGRFGLGREGVRIGRVLMYLGGGMHVGEGGWALEHGIGTIMHEVVTVCVLRMLLSMFAAWQPITSWGPTLLCLLLPQHSHFSSRLAWIEIFPPLC